MSSDEGRTWSWYARIVRPADVPEDCVEGPTEVQLYRYPHRWHAIFRVSALKNFFQPLHHAESSDAGQTWTKPQVLPNVEMLMDPRGLMMPVAASVSERAPFASRSRLPHRADGGQAED